MDYKNMTDIFKCFRDALEQKGFKIRDLIDCWGVCFTFNIKGIKGWRFGLWTYPSNRNVKFFAMHEDGIDKFRPSWAQDIFSFEVPITEDNIKYEVVWWANMAAGIIKTIKYHPIISYNIDSSELSYKKPHIIVYANRKLCILKWKIGDWYECKSKYNVTYFWLKRAKRRLLKLGLYDSIEIIDCNTNGSYCYPRYNVRINCKPTANIEEDCVLVIKQWIFSQYAINGKYMGDNISLIPCQNSNVTNWCYGTPKDEDFVKAFGWKYRVLKYFKRKDKNND